MDLLDLLVFAGFFFGGALLGLAIWMQTVAIVRGRKAGWAIGAKLLSLGWFLGLLVKFPDGILISLSIYAAGYALTLWGATLASKSRLR